MEQDVAAYQSSVTGFEKETMLFAITRQRALVRHNILGRIPARAGFVKAQNECVNLDAELSPQNPVCVTRAV